MPEPQNALFEQQNQERQRYNPMAVRLRKAERFSSVPILRISRASDSTLARIEQ